MRNAIPTFTVTCALALSAGVAAQQTTTGQRDTTQRGDTQRNESNYGQQRGQVTIEGCLQQQSMAGGQIGATQPQGTEGTVQRQGAGAEYVLTNAKIVSGAAGAVGTTGAGQQQGAEQGERRDDERTTPGQSGQMSGNKTFKLTGLNDDRLEQYAGQRVRVQGRLSGMPSESGMSSGARTGGQAETESGARSGNEAGTRSGTGTTAGTGTPAGSTSGAGGAHGQHGQASQFVATSIQPATGGASCPGR